MKLPSAIEYYTRSRTYFKPAMDLLEDESSFTLLFDLPGIDLKNLGVQIKHNTVMVCGSLSSKMKGSGTIIQKERLLGLFERVISFPLEIEKKIKGTHYELGVLQIIVGKKVVTTCK